MKERPPEDQTEIVTGALADQIVRKTTLHLNLAQDAIVITEDKVRLCLINHLQRMESKREWIAPAGILASIILTLATADFHDFYLNADVWRAIFYVTGALVAYWLLRTLRAAFSRSSIEDVVREMKQAGTNQAKT